MKYYDSVVYGATPSGIVAASLMGKRGLRVLVIEPTGHVGGLMTSGLNATDIIGSGSILRGAAREVFQRAGAAYGSPEIEFRAEPHVLAGIFRGLLDEAGVELRTGTRIATIMKTGPSLSHAVLEDGDTVWSAFWIDATYEGDLLPLAGVSCRIGRESAEAHGETMAGRRRLGSMLPAPLDEPIPARDGRGKLLPYLLPPDGVRLGDGDSRLQAFCYRLTLTRNPDNRLPIPEPDRYDPADMELFRRLALSGRRKGAGAVSIVHGTTFNSIFFNLARLRGGKYDMNSGHAAPINLPLAGMDWLGSGPAGRRRIAAIYRDYTARILHFIRTDESVPEETRRFFAEFGFCRDEYHGSDGWPPALYVREGRRLQGIDTLTEHDVLRGAVDPEADIGIGRYPLDCKPIQWTVTADGERAVREGMIFGKCDRYGIRYGMLLPKPEEASNLLASVAASATHIAFASLRMEPHWMIMGAAAGAAVVLATRQRRTLHALAGRAVRALAEADLPHAVPEPAVALAAG
ncbi:FAD-dependent oxidoreductase [Inquilinus limosus]|uniref:FAD-dependent oxidoreductase n=1 Tax=Inquilinus limosus TaxID=171674 RepID=UPI0015C6817C|nr:FAD-dependent oxidoreductase [Inquilinus limosus]